MKQSGSSIYLHLAQSYIVSRLFRELQSEAKYREILVGLDISGDPRLSDLTEVLDRVSRLRAEGIKFAIHLAEVPNNAETKAVLATRPDRIGDTDD